MASMTTETKQRPSKASGAKTMRSELQRQHSRINGSKSKGPISLKGKMAVRFNRLTHGLCAEHVIVPGESAAAFDAVRDALHGEWQPITFTRALLVERMAVAYWKLTRATRVERARTYETAADVGQGVDDRARGLIEGGMNLLPRFPDQALVTFRTLTPGLDHLIGLWEALARAVESGWTSQEEHHDRLLNLLGYVAGSEPLGLTAARASSLLLRSGERCVGAPDPAALSAARTALRRVCAERLEEYRRERSRAWDFREYRKHLIDRAIAPVSKEAQLLHRYERNHEASFLTAMRKLEALMKSGIDLGDGPDEADPPVDETPPEPPAEFRPEPSSSEHIDDKQVVPYSGSFGADDLGSDPGRPSAPKPGPNRRARRAAAASARRSPS